MTIRTSAAKALLQKAAASQDSELALAVLNYLLPTHLDWMDATTTGAETMFRGKKAITPMGNYMSRYYGRGEHYATWHGSGMSHPVDSVDAGIAWLEQQHAMMRGKFLTQLAINQED